MSRPDLDFLTRDAPGFRQLLTSLLDRTPTAWKERSAADAGMVIVELLANELDHLAYAGDRVANEAHIGTARRRQSIRQHAMLADHVLDRGQVSRGHQVFVVDGISPLTLPARTVLGTGRMEDGMRVFETVEDALLDPARNTFYLARTVAAGATRLWLETTTGTANLDPTTLRPGMHLALVEEAKHEHVTIRALTPAYVDLEAPLTQGFLAHAAVVDDSDDTPDGTVVYGNLVPIRRGRTSPWTAIGEGGVTRTQVAPSVWFEARLADLRELVEALELTRARWFHDADAVCCRDVALRHISRVVRILRRSDGAVGQALSEELDADLTRAARTILDLLEALDPWIAQGQSWHDGRVAVAGRRHPVGTPQRAVAWSDIDPTLEVRIVSHGRREASTEVEDFLRSGPADRHHVVEIDHMGLAYIHFGDGTHGALPPVGSTIEARWVTADPFAGNVGARAIDQLEVLLPAATNTPAWSSRILRTFNPVPTCGWRAPEPRTSLSDAIRRELGTPVVAVTADDHVTLLESRSDVAEAAWLGAAPGCVTLVARPSPGISPGAMRDALDAHADLVRLAGTQVEILLPREVSVSVHVVVDLHPEAPPEDTRHAVRMALRTLFGPGTDAKELGTPRTVAEVYRVVERVPGVTWSAVTRFGPSDQPDDVVHTEVALQPDQVARCADVQDEPTRGELVVERARRFSLVLAVDYDDLDTLADEIWLKAQIRQTLSGRRGVPALESWDAITPERVDDALTPLTRGRYGLRVLHMQNAGRRYTRLPVDTGEQPWLDHLDLVATWHRPGGAP